MDDRPFLMVNRVDLQPAIIEDLKRFSRTTYDEEEILSAAGELKYTREIKRFLTTQFMSPGDELVRLLISCAHSGPITKRVRDEFTPIVQRALRAFINDQVNHRLRSALEGSVSSSATDEVANGDDAAVDSTSSDSEIVTTEEELEGYYIVKAILRQVIDVDRVTLRDVRSYCSVLLDDNNRKPLMRMYFHTSSKFIGLFDQSKNLTRTQIDGLDDLYKYAEEIQATTKSYVGAS